MVINYKVTPQGWIICGEETFATRVDLQNREYEDLPDDLTDDGNDDEFEECDDCSDDASDGSGDDWIDYVILFNYITAQCLIIL